MHVNVEALLMTFILYPFIRLLLATAFSSELFACSLACLAWCPPANKLKAPKKSETAGLFFSLSRMLHTDICQCHQTLRPAGCAQEKLRRLRVGLIPKPAAHRLVLLSSGIRATSCDAILRGTLNTLLPAAGSLWITAAGCLS